MGLLKWFGLNTKSLLFGMTLLLTPSLVCASGIPDGFGKLKLGISVSAKTNIKDFNIFGKKWNIYQSKDSNVIVLENLDEADWDDDIKAVARQIEQEIGVVGKDNNGSSIIWEDNGKRMTLGIENNDSCGTSCPILRLYLEKIVDKSKDGFNDFFTDFKSTLERKDTKKLYSMFRVPFKDKMYSNLKSGTNYSFSNYKQFQAKFSKMFTSGVIKELFEQEPTFDNMTSVYYLIVNTAPVRIEKLNGHWQIVEREYAP